jgi:hypothetical protein
VNESRCQADSSVKWLNAKSLAGSLDRSLRFKLDLSQHWTGKNALMLQCKLAVCSANTAEASASDGILQVCNVT